MLHQGPRTFGGNIPEPHSSSISQLLDEFVKIVAMKVQQMKLRRAVVRSMLTCSIVNVLDSQHLFVAAQKTPGMANTQSLYHPDKALSLQEIYDAARWEIGFDAPFVVQFPANALEQPVEQRHEAYPIVKTKKSEN